MNTVQSHWKSLIVLVALAVGIGSFVAFDQPAIQGITGGSPTPTVTAAPTPTPDTRDVTDGRVKAGTFGITITPRPTKPPVVPTGVPSCSGGLAIDLLLDTSSSMKQPSNNPKIDALKEALNNIESQIPDDAVVAMQTFDKQSRSVFGPTILKDMKGEMKDAIKQLRPAGEGGTHVKEGLYKAKKIMDEANTTYPGRGWTLILISDGSPYPYPDQVGTSVAGQLKNAGVNIVTIGLDLDREVNVSPEKARELMRDMASSPSQFYDANTDDIATIYRVLVGKLCQ